MYCAETEMAKLAIYLYAQLPHIEMQLPAVSILLGVDVPEVRRAASSLGVLGGSPLTPTVKASALPVLCRSLSSDRIKTMERLLWEAAFLPKNEAGRLLELDQTILELLA
jgi:hypothetical protein